MAAIISDNIYLGKMAAIFSDNIYLGKIAAIISDNIYLVKWLLLLQIMFNNQKLPAGPRFPGSVSDLKF